VAKKKANHGSQDFDGFEIKIIRDESRPAGLVMAVTDF